jgi:hypothetical protein
MGPLIVALLPVSTAPAYVQDQQPNVAKLKADAQNVVSMIKDDKRKAQAYCKINALDEQIGEADQKNDEISCPICQRVIMLFAIPQK